jgi:SAM-dependent methyltransferase
MASFFSECFRILRPGGVCGFTTWLTSSWIEDVRAAVATIPGAPAIPDATTVIAVLTNGWSHPEYVEEQLNVHGFKDIEVVLSPNFSPIENPACAGRFAGVLLQIVSSKFWTADDRERYGPSFPAAFVKHLTEKHGEGKSFGFEAIAIVATGRKP